jgi:hypothetical protein
MILMLADVIWPAILLEERLFSWWAIVLGLAVEFFFVRWLTALNLRMCVIADLSMNAASALLGIILIPLAGFIWEIFPGLVLYKVFNIGTFNPGTWAATFLLAVFVNAALESLVLRHIFKQQVDKKVFWWLCVANSLSVAIAFGSLFTHQSQT